MNWYDKPLSASWHREDVMAPMHPGEGPTLLLDCPRQIFPRDLFHRANSITRSLLVTVPSGVSTESQPCTASRKLAITSSIVSP